MKVYLPGGEERSGGGLCMGITWDRLAREFIQPTLRPNEFVEALDVNEDGITVIIGTKEGW